MSAILVPFDPAGHIHWPALQGHLGRTAGAGPLPAVNMDTGYVQLLDEAARGRVLALARATSSHPAGFVAGAFVLDAPGASFDATALAEAASAVAAQGGTPVVFPSYGLNRL